MASNNNSKKLLVRNGSIGYLKGETFHPESNFFISQVICCVRLGDRRGYLVKIKGVNQSGESTCFFTLDDTNARKHFLKAINSAHDSGGYMCQLHDVALNRYIMELTDSFKSQRQENTIIKEAAYCQGLNGRKTWVLNESVQVDQHGNQLGEGSTQFVWLGKYTSRYNIVPEKYAAEIFTPFGGGRLDAVLMQVQKCSGENFVPSFLFIASGVMLVHYIFCQSEFQQCPTPFAVGPKGTGKTTAAKVFLSFVGHRQTHLVRQMSEAECIQHCSMSSFPYVYDDPDNLVLVRSIINNFFNGQVRATTRGTAVPKTGCMFTINTEKLEILLKDFKEASRVVMIPFPKLKNANPLTEQVRYEARLSTSLQDASRSVGVIISIAQKISIDDDAISSAVERVEGILGKQVHHRILRSYSMLMMFALKLAEECPQSCPNPQALWDFFEENLPPMIQRYQREEETQCEVSAAEKSTTVLADFVEHLLGPLSSMNSNEARKFVNPAVRCLGKVGYAVARTKGLNVLTETGSSLTGQAVLAAVEEGGLGETNVNRQFSSDVAGKNSKQRAFTFRRTALPSHLRKRLDSVLGYVPDVDEIDEVNDRRNEISIICSTNTRWLINNNVVVAQGEESVGDFHVLYPMSRPFNSGDIVGLSEDYSAITFPTGTKVTFPVRIQPEVEEDKVGEWEIGDEGERGDNGDSHDEEESGVEEVSSDEEDVGDEEVSSDEEEGGDEEVSSDEEEGGVKEVTSDEEEGEVEEVTSDEEEGGDEEGSSVEEEGGDEAESRDEEVSGDEQESGEEEDGDEGESSDEEVSGEKEEGRDQEEGVDEDEDGDKEETEESSKTAALRKRIAKTEAEKLYDHLSGWFKPYKRRRTRK